MKKTYADECLERANCIEFIRSPGEGISIYTNDSGNLYYTDGGSESINLTKLSFDVAELARRLKEAIAHLKFIYESRQNDVVWIRLPPDNLKQKINELESPKHPEEADNDHTFYDWKERP